MDVDAVVMSSLTVSSVETSRPRKQVGCGRLTGGHLPGTSQFRGGSRLRAVLY
jgi:hypothetical protein